MNTRINIILVCFSIAMLGCSTTKYNLPQNYVDESPILPEKMYESKIVYNKDIHDGNDLLTDESATVMDKTIMSLSYLLYVRKSINENWEMPMFPIPLNMTYLFGENDFKKLNRIGYNKFYHTLNFGFTSLAYSSRDGFQYGIGANYLNTFVHKGIFKNEFLSGIEYEHGNENELNDIHVIISNTYYYKLHKYWSPFIMINGGYGYITEEFSSINKKVEENKFCESLGVGMKMYATSFVRINASYQMYLEQYNNDYTKGFINDDDFNSYWNISAAFYW